MEMLTNLCSRVYDYGYKNVWIPSVEWGQAKGYLPPNTEDWRQFYPEKYVKIADRGAHLACWSGSQLYSISVWLFTYLVMIYSHAQIAYEKYTTNQRKLSEVHSDSATEEKPISYVKTIWKTDIKGDRTHLWQSDTPEPFQDHMHFAENPDYLYYVHFLISSEGPSARRGMKEGILICRSTTSDTQQLLTVDTTNKVLSAELESEGIQADVTDAVNLYVTVPANQKLDVTLRQILHSDTSVLMEEDADVLKIVHADARMSEYTRCCHLKRFWNNTITNQCKQ